MNENLSFRTVHFHHGKKEMLGRSIFILEIHADLVRLVECIIRILGKTALNRTVCLGKGIHNLPHLSFKRGGGNTYLVDKRPYYALLLRKQCNEDMSYLKLTVILFSCILVGCFHSFLQFNRKFIEIHIMPSITDKAAHKS